MDKKDFLDVAELDVVEESIWRFDSSVLRRLLQDMTRFGFVSAMMVSANTMKHVRETIVYNHQKIREA